MMAAPPGHLIGMMLAPYGSDLEDEVQLREEDLRPNDVVFSAMGPTRYRNVIREHVIYLEEKWGSVNQWGKDALDKEADLAVAELKEGGGRLLKPEGGLSSLRTTEYSIMSDDDAVKRAKAALKARGICLLQQKNTLKSKTGEPDDQSIFSDATAELPTTETRRNKCDSAVSETSAATAPVGRKKRKTSPPKKYQPSMTLPRKKPGKAKGRRSSAGRTANTSAVGNNDDPIVVDVDAKEEDAKTSAVVVVDLMQKAALYDATREKLNQSTDLNEKKFYGGLKRHINEHFHKDLTSADLEKVQSYIADFETLLKRLHDESNDHDDILNAQKTIDMHLESLPLSN